MPVNALPTNALTYTGDLVSLPYTFISVTGTDAEKLLHGQVSCDVRSLDEHTVSYGTTNTAKGRMYGLFKIARVADGFLLRIENTCTQIFLAHLKKYVAFFKAEIEVNNQFRAFGQLSLIDGGPERPNHFVRNGKDLVIRCQTKSPMFEIWSPSQAKPVSRSPEQWFVQETLSGIPELYSETQEKFILQHINLQHLGAVSFNKGCYTGQEIIARIKFRGKLKKKTFLLQTREKNIAPPGTDIFDEKGQKCGVLVRAHWSDETGTVALGVLDASYIESSKQVFLNGTNHTPFQVSELIY